MTQDATTRPIPQPTFMDYFGTYGGMAVKAIIFFIILGFITVPLWKSVYDASNFWNYLLMGMAISFGLVIFLLLLGVVTAILSKIFSIFKTKN